MTSIDADATRSGPSPGAPAEAVAAFVASAHARDVADWLGALTGAEVSHHLSALPLARRADVFEYLPPDVQVDRARIMDADELIGILVEMDSDDRVDLFKRLTGTEQQGLLEALPGKERSDLERLAAHEEGTAGAIMTSDFATLEPAMTARDAIAALRRAAPDAETIYRSYVLDGRGRLVGSIRLHDLVLSTEDALVGDLMEAAPVIVAPEVDQETVAKAIARYDTLAIAVVDADGRVVGIVTHDDAADALQAATTEDFQKVSTVRPIDRSLRDAGIWLLYRKRIAWLTLRVFGNLFSGAGISHFEEMILAYVSLIFFLPLLIDSSGNAGSQSATLMVRALATGDVKLADWRSLILRELLVATAPGVTMALVVAPVGAFRAGPEIALVVALTMFVLVIAGSLVGMSLPFLLSRLRLDPATASGPLVTSTSDALGVLIYFSIATTVLAA